MREYAAGYAVLARHQDYWAWLRAWVLPICEHLARLRIGRAYACFVYHGGNISLSVATVGYPLFI